jgi:hypothetical protein
MLGSDGGRGQGPGGAAGGRLARCAAGLRAGAAHRAACRRDGGDRLDLGTRICRSPGDRCATGRVDRARARAVPRSGRRAGDRTLGRTAPRSPPARRSWAPGPGAARVVCAERRVQDRVRHGAETGADGGRVDPGQGDDGRPARVLVWTRRCVQATARLRNAKAPARAGAFDWDRAKGQCSLASTVPIDCSISRFLGRPGSRRSVRPRRKSTPARRWLRTARTAAASAAAIWSSAAFRRRAMVASRSARACLAASSASALALATMRSACSLTSAFLRSNAGAQFLRFLAQRRASSSSARICSARLSRRPGDQAGHLEIDQHADKDQEEISTIEVGVAQARRTGPGASAGLAGEGREQRSAARRVMRHPLSGGQSQRRSPTARRP